jgi:hypothetical protein
VLERNLVGAADDGLLFFERLCFVPSGDFDFDFRDVRPAEEGLFAIGADDSAGRVDAVDAEEERKPASRPTRWGLLRAVSWISSFMCCYRFQEADVFVSMLLGDLLIALQVGVLEKIVTASAIASLIREVEGPSHPRDGETSEKIGDHGRLFLVRARALAHPTCRLAGRQHDDRPSLSFAAFQI